ncbi:RimK family alpha-L-glutamate ligase [Peribacillus cavernae]|uniref:RimK family alpha-L-glutamate ligase n=1 Tax=Peribacillus cavernae TaxID=1674310 RepID=A0A433HHI6_9BACI|nr:RimK family alpha-L-glutamate ligase [Peribacillus cavernae]MDQ0219385.1 ribosomal protein S6--L-glutamate ligase/gamma-F420-2:alpha-L-glutamate ligase [Peribacillus cavernae]RUQ27739.1 RimK family alpha-L-glutamate ligase [Peribacillus cavernae]
MSEKISCWIIVNGYLQQKKFSDLALFMKEAADRKKVRARIVRNTELTPVLKDGMAELKGSLSGSLPDFIIFMDKDIHLARHLERIGVPVYNSSAAIEVCDSKAKTHQALANQGIPMPRTVFPPFTYEGIEREHFEPFKEIGKYLGYPLVVKEAYGSFGQEVYLVESETELIEMVKKIAHKPFILQEFVQSSKGKDIRLNVVGEKVVASMLRTSETDFRANVTNGGKTEAYSPTPEEIELAVKCAGILGTDFAGIDLLFGESGPLLCEVNSNSHLLNIYECTGVNIADYMIDYILERQAETKR